MNTKLLRILTIILSFFFLTGFVPFSIIGPSVTALTSGNFYKAGAQFIINQSIEKETGKNSFMYVKEEIDKKIKKKSINEELIQLVEKRIKLTRKKLNDQNLQKLLTNQIKITRSILNLNKTTQ
tara:strand:- start:72 stop:443 length:372 start_codon:yes stop_codon:yes gene_type:complete